MDWFERLTGFREDGEEPTRRRLEVDGGWLRSRVNGARYRTGPLEIVSLADLGKRAALLVGWHFEIPSARVDGHA